MEILSVILKLIVGLSIINVWTLNASKPSKCSVGSAETLAQEFAVYGLPKWLMFVIGAFKISLSLMLIASIYESDLTQYAGLGLAFFLSGSVLSHLKINDPFYKSIPALSFLLLCLVLVYLN